MSAKKYRKPTVPLSNEGKLKVTKIEAAVFQLETAIKLWFSDGDPVSMVPLIYSAYEILSKLSKARGIQGQTLEEPDPVLFANEQVIAQWKTIFRSDHVFCKHGSADASECHFIATSNFPLVIGDAVRIYLKLGFPTRAYFTAFLTWLQMTHPEIFIAKPPQSLSDQVALNTAVQAIVHQGKRQFLELFDQYLSGGMARPWSPVVHPTGA
jgi:hypothetical protein